LQETWQIGGMSHPPIAIAGAGIAGLATALALGERHVVVFEQASSFSPVGAGLQLGPNAVRALQKLGAWDAVAPSTSSPPEIHIRDGVSGRLLKQLPLGRAFEKRYGAPYQVALRADLHTGLLAVVKTRRNVVVELGQRIAVDSSSAQGVQVTTDCGQRLFEKLFATDGVQSAIRQSLFPGMQAIDAFETCHRAQVRTPDVSNVALDCVNLWFFPGGHVVHYPVGPQQALNMIAITPSGALPVTFFAQAAPALRDILHAARGDFTAWPGLYVEPLKRWSAGHVMLLGDAAHGTLPYLAQGAAMALEDAATLHQALAGGATLQQSMAETEDLRRPRTTSIHIASLRAGQGYHHRHIMRLARNMVLRAVPDSFLNQRTAWIYHG
jgi:salicylate hydroxylase